MSTSSESRLAEFWVCQNWRRFKINWMHLEENASSYKIIIYEEIIKSCDFTFVPPYYCYLHFIYVNHLELGIYYQFIKVDIK